MKTLWVHGWASDSKVFKPLLTALPVRLRENPVLVDLPGFGADVREQKDYAAFLAAQVERESLDGPVMLTGWSMGAMAALEAAAEKSDKVTALVLISGCARFVDNPDNPGGKDPRVLKAMIHRLRRDSARVVEDFQAGMFSDGEQRKREQYLAGQGNNYKALPTAALADGLEYLLSADIRPRLEKITAPTLLIHGSCDSVIDITLARALADSLGTARIHELDNTGHAPHLTQTEQTAQFIAEFIKPIQE